MCLSVAEQLRGLSTRPPTLSFRRRRDPRSSIRIGARSPSRCIVIVILVLGMFYFIEIVLMSTDFTSWGGGGGAW